MARAAAFHNRGHKTQMISPVPAESTLIEVSSPPPVGLKGVFGHLYVAAWTAWRLLHVRAEIYHAHYAAEIGTWLAWLLCKRPLVISVMGGDVLFNEQGTIGPLGHWLTRRSLASAALVTVKSPLLADVVAGFGVPRSRIETVIWGVDQKIFSHSQKDGMAYRQKLGISEQAQVVFSPRMLQPFYRIDVLIDAWPQMLTAIPSAVLVLSTFNADPVYQNKLKRKAAAAGVSHSIIFAPKLTQSEMRAAYSAANIAVSIPPSDGFPQTALEAAACLCPLILSDLPRLYDFFAPDHDAVYTATNPQSVADAVLHTLQNSSATKQRAVSAYKKVREGADFNANVARVEARMHHLLDQEAK